jgi:calcineurin-like phosphoesterase family protein
MIYFTADTHFDHEIVVKRDKRPFKDVKHMNAELTRRWNEVVRPEDTVYHLGDFAVGYLHQIGNFAKALNGRKILLLGGFDRRPEEMSRLGFSEVKSEIYQTIDDIPVFMTHHPRPKDQWGKAQYHLTAHHHLAKRVGNMINVGVDQWDFTPRTLAELLIVPRE